MPGRVPDPFVVVFELPDEGPDRRTCSGAEQAEGPRLRGVVGQDQAVAILRIFELSDQLGHDPFTLLALEPVRIDANERLQCAFLDSQHAGLVVVVVRLVVKQLLDQHGDGFRGGGADPL